MIKWIKWIINFITELFADPVDIEDIPTPDPEKLETVDRVFLWMESSEAKLQDITNSKRCSMNPHDVIITDTDVRAMDDITEEGEEEWTAHLKEIRKIQSAGGLVCLTVHVFYAPWNRGMNECIERVEKIAKYYDYIALDYEGPLANADFAKRLQQFGKPLIIVPMARDDAMNEYYEGLAGIEGAIFAWWNYSSGLVAWVKFFKDYEFRPSCKHLVLLSIGDKYDQYVSDAEIKNIIINLKNIRAGSFLPKNDYPTFRTMKKDLIKTK